MLVGRREKTAQRAGREAGRICMGGLDQGGTSEEAKTEGVTDENIEVLKELMLRSFTTRQRSKDEHPL